MDQIKVSHRHFRYRFAPSHKNGNYVGGMFGKTRMSGTKMHYGYDISAQPGTDFFSMHDGIAPHVRGDIPGKIIQFKHIGSVIDGQEQLVNDGAKKWSGATETYSLVEGTGFFTLLVEIDILDEHVEFMSEKLPIGLKRLK